MKKLVNGVWLNDGESVSGGAAPIARPATSGKVLIGGVWMDKPVASIIEPPKPSTSAVPVPVTGPQNLAKANVIPQPKSAVPAERTFNQDDRQLLNDILEVAQDNNTRIQRLAQVVENILDNPNVRKLMSGETLHGAATAAQLTPRTE